MTEPNAYLDAYQEAWSAPREQEIQNARVVYTDELTHEHQCVDHAYACTVMICRDQREKTCWEHRMREPSERPRVS